LEGLFITIGSFRMAFSPIFHRDLIGPIEAGLQAAGLPE
jgi:hypothetical protein